MHGNRAAEKQMSLSESYVTRDISHWSNYEHRYNNAKVLPFSSQFFFYIKKDQYKITGTGEEKAKFAYCVPTAVCSSRKVSSTVKQNQRYVMRFTKNS
jgi:hypothetical protein